MFIHSSNDLIETEPRSPSSIEILNLDTRATLRHKASTLQPVCQEDHVHCECEDHKKLATMDVGGVFHANVQGGQNQLEIDVVPDLNENELIAKVKALTVSNRNSLNKFIDTFLA